MSNINIKHWKFDKSRVQLFKSRKIKRDFVMEFQYLIIIVLSMIFTSGFCQNTEHDGSSLVFPSQVNVKENWNDLHDPGTPYDRFTWDTVLSNEKKRHQESLVKPLKSPFTVNENRGPPIDMILGQLNEFPELSHNNVKSRMPINLRRENNRRVHKKRMKNRKHDKHGFNKGEKRVRKGHGRLNTDFQIQIDKLKSRLNVDKEVFRSVDSDSTNDKVEEELTKKLEKEIIKSRLQRVSELGEIYGDEPLTETSKQTLKDSEYPEVGDLSCMNGTFMPAPRISHALIKYVKSSNPGHEYLEADYECISGYSMSSNSSRLLCKNREWIGDVPLCEMKKKPDEACLEMHCDHTCKEINSKPECICYEGFRLEENKCIDIDECDEANGGCQYTCVNTIGHFRCECPRGMKYGKDKFTCIDIDECLVNNGRGPCQDICRNFEGGYVCSCESLPGTTLTSDNHTCRDVGPCDVENAGCSHTCLATAGRVFCLCPDGFVLQDDWKTCQDVDECAVPELQTEDCRYGCVNTPGSYHCADPDELKDQREIEHLENDCPNGYRKSPQSSCVDINECDENNGGCHEVCENTNGNYFCACNGDEKILSSDGKSCAEINDVLCPALNSVKRGTLVCLQPGSRNPLAAQRDVHRPRTKCYLKCPPGYQLHGEYQLICHEDGSWKGPGNGECIQYLKPHLECPKDITVEVPPDRDEAFVKFNQPSTDLDWFRYVRSIPSWGTRLEASLKPGMHAVTFVAQHPISKQQSSCLLRIIVKDGESPKVRNCPNNVIGKNSTFITWEEPIFTDNVKVTRITSNESPGRVFNVGKWKITYEASDEAGWTTECTFDIIIRQESS